jgi:hypothetical protein
MSELRLAEDVLDRMVRAVEKVRERRQRAVSAVLIVFRCEAMLRLFVRTGVTAALALLMIYLYLILASIYQGQQPFADLKLETTVRKIEIAGPAATADVQWSKADPNRWLVVFDVDRVVKGRFEEPQVRFVVHSPSADLSVRDVGQHVTLERRNGAWERPQ